MDQWWVDLDGRAGPGDATTIGFAARVRGVYRLPAGRSHPPIAAAELSHPIRCAATRGPDRTGRPDPAAFNFPVVPIRSFLSWVQVPWSGRRIQCVAGPAGGSCLTFQRRSY